MSGNTLWRLIITLVAIGGSLFFTFTQSPQLGLDLKGGSQVVLDLKSRTGGTVTSAQANQTLEILRRRVDSLGATEPNLEVSNGNRIIVELPGISDADKAVEIIGSTAQLTFHPVEALVGQEVAPTSTTTPAGTATTASTTTPATTTAPATTAAPTNTTTAGLGDVSANSAASLGQATTETTAATTTAAPSTTPPATTAADAAAAAAATNGVQPGPSTQDQSGAINVADDAGAVYQLGASTIDGNGVGDANAAIDPQNGQWYISIDFKGDGGSAWAQLTGTAACSPQGDVKRQVAIVLDNRIISHPEVNESITCGTGITGGSTQITGGFTQKDAQDLALLIKGGALPVNVSVAQQSEIGPELGDQAIADSYKAVAIGGLLTLLFVLAYYRFLGLFAMVALTVYALVSYAVVVALHLTLTLPGIAGFILAIGMAMDSNILVYERVKEELAAGRQMRTASRLGFKNALSAIIDSNLTTFLAAGTLFLLAVGEVKGFGITLAVGTAVSIFVTLVVLRLLVEGILSTNWASRHPRLLGMYVGAKFRKRITERPPRVMHWAKYSLVLSGVLILISLVGIGVKGINYGIEFTGGRFLEYSTAQPVDLDRAREGISELGFEGATVQRSGAQDTSVRVPQLTTDQQLQVENLMKELGGGTVTKLRDETTGPSFGAELKQKALIGLIIGVSAQLILVAFRFRWTFGIGAVVGMLHDALLVLGLFVWTGREFDSVFLAALLTIIAYSVNDSVVVFDRIREQRRRRAGEQFADVVSDACAQTFPRTINISLCTMFILVALLFLGGQTLADFALALVVGVGVGITSSIFVAAPITVALEKWKPTMSARSTSSAARRSTRTQSTRTATAKPGSVVTKDDVDEAQGDETTRPASGNRPAPRPRKKSKKRR